MKIAITQRVLVHNNFSYDSISHGWYDLAAKYKHSLEPVQNRIDLDYDAILNSCDTLIISGGNNHPIRDEVEHKLINLFYDNNKPIFGVCHGFLLLTKHFGGDISEIDNHHNTGHYVYDGVGSKQWVNSYHGYCVKKIPPGVTVLATDPEGNCEAWINDKVGGVIWHPERQPYTYIPPTLESFFY